MPAKARPSSTQIAGGKLATTTRRLRARASNPRRRREMPKTVLDKVVAAIGALAEPGGASRPAIAKAVKAADGEVSAALLKAALSKGVAKGVLEQSGQRFALVGVTLAPREVAQVESAVLKEGSGEPCAVGDTVSMAYVGSLQVAPAREVRSGSFKRHSHPHHHQVDGSVFDQAKTFSFQLGAGVRRVGLGFGLG